MSCSKFSLGLLAVLIVILGGLNASSALKAEAATSCQCVQYVQNYLGLPAGGGFTNAEDMGVQLKAEGFVKLSQPKVGAVEVFNHSHPYVDPAAGHVGIILAVQSYNNDTQWKLKIRSANLYGQTNYFTDSGCTNVSDTWFTPFSKSATTVAYWARPTTPAPSGDSLTDLFLYMPGTGSSYVEFADGKGGWRGAPGPKFSTGWNVYTGNFN